MSEDEQLLWRTQFSRTCPLCGNTCVGFNPANRNLIECAHGHWWTRKEAEDYQQGRITEQAFLYHIYKRARRREDND